MGDLDFWVDPLFIKNLAKEIREVYELGVQIAIVIGGWKYFLEVFRGNP